MLRYKVLCKYVAAKQLDIVGLQEPHNLISSQERKVSKYFADLGCHLCSSSNHGGRGEHYVCVALGLGYAASRHPLPKNRHFLLL